MFQVQVRGRVAAWDGEVLTVHVPHVEDGYRRPVPVVCHVPPPLRAMVAESIDVVPGRDDKARASHVWIAGRGYQFRPYDDVIELTVEADFIAPIGKRGGGRGPIWASVHGRIHGPLEPAVATSGWRKGEPVVRFVVHVQSPLMDPGVPIVLRCKAWGEDAQWIARRHAGGDRINLEGDLTEQRWTSRDGAPRIAHQIHVRRWTYAKDGPEATT